ncbi:hypothetical protein ACQP2P_40170 [Dactylosporangium sp. CA-139114]|uniref:hypothetical protein n=1 Tax=Dactylosporangium sp. CA-139114 TaxID=3239931 RepID=UPI003D9958F3
MTATGSGAGPDGWAAAWAAALDAMELEADAVEQLLRHRELPPQMVFTPPEGIGPLPLELTERARRLVQRQLDLSRELSIAIAGNRQQARLVNRMQREGGMGAPPPVYLDNRT